MYKKWKKYNIFNQVMVKKKKHKNVRKLQKMYFDNVVAMIWQNILEVQKKGMKTLRNLRA